MGESRAGEHGLAEAIDGAGEDWSVSGDAMRWSPGRARDGGSDGFDVAGGIGSVLGVHPDTVRRLVSRAVTPFAVVASDVLDELRGLSRPGLGVLRPPRRDGR
jgi:serine/threonine-protein kinase RsbW